MKPTQEQIDAALRYAFESETRPDALLLGRYNPRRMISFSALTILAAAYREAMDEIKTLKSRIKEENYERRDD